MATRDKARGDTVKVLVVESSMAAAGPKAKVHPEGSVPIGTTPKV